MNLAVNGASYEVSEDELLFDIPSGNVTISTDAPVVFWCAAPDPSVRKGDYRTELQRLHAGTPVTIGSVPDGWKIAVSLSRDLEALHRERPRPPPEPPPPGPTEEQLAARKDAREDRQFERHVIDVMKARYLAEFDEPDSATLDAALEEARAQDDGHLFSDADDIDPLQVVEAERDEARESLKVANERIAELESREPEVRIERVEVERVVTVSSPEAAPLRIIPEEIAAMMDEGETFTHDVRRKLTERLNVELAELKNLRGLAGEDLKREAEIEKLLGLFARLGEI